MRTKGEMISSEIYTRFLSTTTGRQMKMAIYVAHTSHLNMLMTFFIS